jgi:hypothetical protein
MDDHCCEMMQNQMNFVCEQHPNRFECPDCVIHFNPKSFNYGIIIHDGGSSFYRIRFCPWCGTKLPEPIDE